MGRRPSTVGHRRETVTLVTGRLRPTDTGDQADRDPLHGEAAAHPVRWWMDLVGVAWVLGAAVAVLLPTLHHGIYLGSYDWISQYGLSKQSGVAVHHPFDGDQITQMIPWTSLAWTQVHHGQLPLWNPYSVSGTPLAFNWQSAAFSLPALVGYRGRFGSPTRSRCSRRSLWRAPVPMCWVGSCRLNVMACAFAGVAFELCGSFIGWIGWPVASVVSWSGWILASVILVTRGGHRWRSVLLLSVTLALAILAGQPDTLVLLMGFVAVFATSLLIAQFNGENSRPSCAAASSTWSPGPPPDLGSVPPCSFLDWHWPRTPSGTPGAGPSMRNTRSRSA